MATEEYKQSDNQRWSVEESDRPGLLETATRVVYFVGLMKRPEICGGLGASSDLDEVESRAYHAALGLLTREFERGPAESTSHLVESSVETERTVEKRKPREKKVRDAETARVRGDDEPDEACA